MDEDVCIDWYCALECNLCQKSSYVLLDIELPHTIGVFKLVRIGQFFNQSETSVKTCLWCTIIVRCVGENCRLKSKLCHQKINVRDFQNAIIIVWIPVGVFYTLSE